MTGRITRALTSLLLTVATTAAAAAEPRLLALCYHDVVTSAAEARADPMAVTVDALTQQFSWLAANGYQPISLEQWAAAAAGEPLPDKPVLLTFDDGYASFHDHVMPLLALFDFPAVLAPVTSWIDAPAGATVDYGDETVSRKRFMNWAEVREVAATGLVEIASHSHDLHHGILGNPFGNTQPAAITRRYDPETGYEPEDVYLDRVGEDLARSVALIRDKAGLSPRAMVWPYGAYNAQVTALARSLGMAYGFTLAELANSPTQHNVHRLLVGSDMTLSAFAMTMAELYPPRPLRSAHVDLDYVYDPDPVQMGRNLDRLLDRIKALRINRVFLQAYADPDGDGVADALYFPNRHLPVRKDLFNRVSWQLKTRAGTQVFAWMPVLAFRLPDAQANARLAVTSTDGSHTGRYHRLSPFDDEARRLIEEIYEDLGRYSNFLGVLFHDDAFLTDREDASPAALAAYEARWGSRASVDEDGVLVVPGVQPDALAAFKARYLADFIDELAAVLRRHQPALITARNLYARTVTHPESQRWFAQSLPLFLERYDYAALMAMPYMEGADDPDQWLSRLAEAVARHPAGLERTVFELQTVNWRTGEPLSDKAFARQADVLLDAGVRHLAWYPDDFVRSHPDPRVLRSRFSLSDHPALLK